MDVFVTLLRSEVRWLALLIFAAIVFIAVGAFFVGLTVGGKAAGIDVSRLWLIPPVFLIGGIYMAALSIRLLMAARREMSDA